MSKKQEVREIPPSCVPPSCVLLVNICCKGCVKDVNKLFKKIDRKHATRTTIAAQLEQGKAHVIVTGNIDKAIISKKLKKMDKIPTFIEPVHEDKGSSSTSSEVQQPNPSKNNNDNKNVAPMIEKKPEKNADSEKKEEKNKGKEIEEIKNKEEKNKSKEIEEIKNKGQEEQRASMGPMNSRLAGPMGGHPTGQMTYGHPMSRSIPPQQRQEYSSIFDEDNANGCRIM